MTEIEIEPSVAVRDPLRLTLAYCSLTFLSVLFSKTLPDAFILLKYLV